jgi:hypothetical protein
VGPSFVPSGDLRADMDRLRVFYQGIGGRVESQNTPVMLREELEAAAVEGTIGFERVPEPAAARAPAAI